MTANLSSFLRFKFVGGAGRGMNEEQDLRGFESTSSLALNTPLGSYAGSASGGGAGNGGGGLGAGPLGGLRAAGGGGGGDGSGLSAMQLSSKLMDTIQVGVVWVRAWVWVTGVRG